MAGPRKHHILPEFYLKRFSEDGKVWVYDRERDDLSNLRPETVGIRKDFYRLKQGGRDEENLPEAFLGKVESKAAPVIAKIDRGGQITRGDRRRVVDFVALLKSRVPSFARWLSDFSDDYWVRHLRMLFPTEEALRLSLAEKGDPAPEDPAEVRKLFRGIQNGDYMLKTPKDYRIGSMFRLALDVMAEPLFSMSWEVLRASSEAAFITTDNPFVVVPPKGVEPVYPYLVGVAVEGAKKLVPLTRSVCLRIGDAGDGTAYVGCPTREVQEINEVLAANYDRFLFGPEERLVGELSGEGRRGVV